MAVLLGSVVLDGFEVNARIAFGGRQKLAVHHLPGGVRVIDAMGPDDHDIAWEGVFSGADASSRARAVEALRVAGTPVTLAWDVFAATVLVADVRLAFRNSWWIPYRLSCMVLSGTELPPIMTASVDALAAVLADLGKAASIESVQTAIALVGSTGATTAGSVANATAAASLTVANTDIATTIAAAETGMQASDISTLIQSAAALSTLTVAAGFAGRARTNFAGIGM